MLQRQDYARLRIGVGPAPAGLDDLADFVLDRVHRRGAPSAIDELLDPMSEAVECWVENGIEKAMNQFNRESTA